MKTFLAAAAVLVFGGIFNLFGAAAAAQVRDRNPFNEDDITFQDLDLIPRTWVAVIVPFDSDGDGILNVFEILSGCLNASDPDTDDDGIPDGVETSGIINGFDFNLEGANPCRRDIFVELDAEQRTVGMVLQDAQFGAGAAASAG